MLSDEIRKGEIATLELKRDVPKDHLKFLKTVVAFANGAGGRIIFGVDDDRSIVGMDAMLAFNLKKAVGLQAVAAAGCWEAGGRRGGGRFDFEFQRLSMY